MAPCANPDPANCDALCAEHKGAAACSVQGRDSDKDGYLSSACASKPGDDCNDAVAAIHPGAPEICDRIDNDCNGKIDVADGLPVSGTTAELGPSGATRGTPAIAWATDRSVYGIGYFDGTTSATNDLYFETVDKTGAVALAPVPLHQTLSGGAPLVLAWGKDEFAESFTTNDTPMVYFTTISSTGSELDSLSLDTDGLYVAVGGLARSSSGAWAVLYSFEESSAYFVQTVPALTSPYDYYGRAAVSPGAGRAVVGTSGLAVSGSTFAIGYSVPVNSASVSLWDASFASSTPLTVNGRVPVVGSGASGFAVAVTPAVLGDPPKFYEYSAAGAALCGPVNFADKDFEPAAIVATTNGYLVVSSGVVRVQEVLAHCAMGSLFMVDPGPAENVGIAGSAVGYGVVWQDTNLFVPKLRVFGPDFCN